jgi:hypothetical protein
MSNNNDCIENVCCSFWLSGCGLNLCFGILANGFDAMNPALECISNAIWMLGSPLAFPIVFCFDSGPDTNPPGGGWQIPMIMTPCRTPCRCCFYTLCPPCGQWIMRYKALNGDMTRYKLWQGQHDGPHCCARVCPGAPITIESGTYGEDQCPHCFLCLEVSCLAGIYSTCCAFDVSRNLVKSERNLLNDPTEVRVNSCIRFFSAIANTLCMLGCCCGIAACLVGWCAPNSGGAQECSEEAGQAARSCRQCAYTCWRGIWSVKVIAMGCMSAQMDYEIKVGRPLPHRPQMMQMERDDDNDEDAWWKQQ